MAVSEDRSKVATVQNYRKMQIWKVEDGLRMHQIQSECCIEDVAISANATRIVTGDRDGQVVL